MRSAVLCGASSIEYADTTGWRTDFGTDGFELGLNIVYEYPEIVLAYDRVYLWEHAYDQLDAKTEDRKTYFREIVQESIQQKVLAPIVWPIEDRRRSNTLREFSSILARLVADRLEYPLYDDFFVLAGLIGELECARSVRRVPVVARGIQFEWINDIGALLRKSTELRSTMESAIDRLMYEFQDRPGEDEYSDDRRILAELRQELAVLARPRRPPRLSHHRQYLDTFTALVPEFNFVGTGSHEQWADIEVLFSWRDSMVEFRKEVDRLASDASIYLTADTTESNRKKLLQMMLERDCDLVKELIFDSFPRVKAFRRVLTSNTLAFTLDLLLAGISVMTGIPSVPGASLVPAILGDHLRDPLVNRALRTGSLTQSGVEWYREWVSWRSSVEYDKSDGLWKFR